MHMCDKVSWQEKKQSALQTSKHLLSDGTYLISSLNVRICQTAKVLQLIVAT